MTVAPPEFTIGIEEEYLLVDRETRDVVADPPKEMLSECQALLTGQVSPEFLRAQIEVETRVCNDLAEARADLSNLRMQVAKVAAGHGLAIICSATHPFADWERQKHTDRQRYNEIADDMQALARRLVICGLHVHVGISDEDLRTDLMNQMVYFLPHILALSTSSPFWRGEETGLASYRLSVLDELPRTGLPDQFESYGEYRRLVGEMTGAGLIRDATKIWWDIRLSARFPTLEMRVADACTRLDDTLTVAALYICVLRMLFRLRTMNQRWRVYPRSLVGENRWLAQRFGTTGDLVDFGKGKRLPFKEVLEELIELVREDAEAFGCVADLEHAREIYARGTSGQRQVATYRAALAAGADRKEALVKVVDMLMEDTLAGLNGAAATA
jgi:carboxylate-amine ligase